MKNMEKAIDYGKTYKVQAVKMEESKVKNGETYKVRTVRFEEFYLFAKNDQEARDLSRSMAREQKVKRINISKIKNGESKEITMIDEPKTSKK